METISPIRLAFLYLWICCWGACSTLVESFVSSFAHVVPKRIVTQVHRQGRSEAPRRHHQRLYFSSSVENTEKSTASSDTNNVSDDSVTRHTILDGASTRNTIPIPAAILEKQQTKNYDYPWTDLQEWALFDQLPRYTIQVASTKTHSGDQASLQVFTLWRTLSNEVVELSGYPLQFLVDRQMEFQAQQNVNSPQDDSDDQDKDAKRRTTITRNRRRSMVRTSPIILPFLDDFDFTTAGGLSGAVYGVQGIADGTRIETSPVSDIHSTIPKGFVRTTADDNGSSVLYELGRPRQAESSWRGVGYSMGSRVANNAVSSLANNDATQKSSNLSPIQLDEELLQLGALTAMVLVGAAAFESLSHHLTVNFFWV